MFEKYKIEGWQDAYSKLKTQLADYDAWLKATILVKARADFHLPSEEYAIRLEDFGIDITPDQLTEVAHKAFNEIQAEMRPIAAQIAEERHLPSCDYRDVIGELKKQQIVGDRIMPLLPGAPGRNRENHRRPPDRQFARPPGAHSPWATAGETVQQPAPHMVPPPFLHNTGEKGEFVLPLNIPAASGDRKIHAGPKPSVRARPAR